MDFTKRLDTVLESAGLSHVFSPTDAREHGRHRQALGHLAASGVSCPKCKGPTKKKKHPTSGKAMNHCEACDHYA